MSIKFKPSARSAEMGVMKKIILLPLLLAATSSCMKQHSNAILNSSHTATSGIGCEAQLQSKVFDSMYSYLDEQQEIPDLEELKSVISLKIDEIAKEQNIHDGEQLEIFKQEYNKIFDILISDSRRAKNVSDIKEHIQTLIEMEMEDQSSTANIQLNNKLATQFSKVKSLSNALNLACNEDPRNNPPPPGDDDTASTTQTYTRMTAGMSNVIATAYQSCQSIEIPPITGATQDVLGITRLPGSHPDGIGGRRVVGNLSQVQSTHPYVNVAGNTTSSSCFNVHSNPLIYDYGGEPSVSGNIINFFKNAGSGTTVLGVDCSALVSAAAAVGGLRYKPGVDNKAIYIRQSSSKFISATSSGFTCYDNITLTPTQTIKSGDIAAVVGHVVMVDTVGNDPFGLNLISSESQCSTINYRNFDFTVAQSSPSKNGIGINRYVARDYLSESYKMQTLFVSMAKSACTAKFQNRNVKPSSSSWGIIRHKGTSQCIAPKIQMTNQSCVSQCRL